VIDRAHLLVADLERIPAILRALAIAEVPGFLVRAGVPAPSHVVLTGLGSSRFAALAVQPTMQAAGLHVVVEHASTSQPVPVGPGVLVVAVSSSGRTAETVAAATRARIARAHVIGVTNDQVSPLAAAADEIYPLAAGVEASGVASATYAATVAALVRLAATLVVGIDARGVLAGAADAADQALASRSSWLTAAADTLDGGTPIHVLADAAALGTAEQAALLFREAPRLDADATDSGDWLHTGIYTALPGYRAVLLAGTPYDDELIATIQRRGGRIISIGQTRAGMAEIADIGVPLPADALADVLVRALVEPVVTTALAAELWRRARGSSA